MRIVLERAVVERERKDIADEAREEGRREVYEAQSERFRQRVYLHDRYMPLLVGAQAVRPGDVLLHTDDGYTFYERAEVTAIRTDDGNGGPIAGDFWFTQKFRDGGTGGRAMRRGQPVLIRVDE